MCGSVCHRDAETTRNELRTNKSHLQIFGQNRMNGSVGDVSVFFQLHDGYSSIILNQLSQFFNQRNSGNFLTALRISEYKSVQGLTCTANPRITRLIRSEKSSRNTKTRKVNNL